VVAQLLLDGSFESGSPFTDWASSAITATQRLASPVANHGSQYARLTTTATGLAQFAVTLPATAGLSYSVGADIRVQTGAGSRWRVRMSYFDAGAVGLAQNDSSPTITGTFARATYTTTAPANTATLIVSFARLSSGAVSGDAIDVDAVLVTEGTYSGAYVGYDHQGTGTAQSITATSGSGTGDQTPTLIGVTSQSVTTGSSTALAMTWPSGTAAGDLAYVVGTVGAGAAITMGLSTSGWAEHYRSANSASTGQFGLWSKILTSTDITTPPSVTSSSARQVSGAVLVARNAALDVLSAINAQSSVTTGTLLAVTPGSSMDIDVGFVTGAATVVNSARSFTPPAGWDERADLWSTNTTSARIGVGIFTRLAGTGGVSTGTADFTASATSILQSVRVTIKAVAAAYGTSQTLEATLGNGTGTALIPGTGTAQTVNATLAAGVGTMPAVGTGTAQSVEVAASNAAGKLAATGTGTGQTTNATLGAGVGTFSTSGTGTGQAVDTTLGAGVGKLAATGTGTGQTVNATLGSGTGTTVGSGTGTGQTVNATQGSGTGALKASGTGTAQTVNATLADGTATISVVGVGELDLTATLGAGLGSEASANVGEAVGLTAGLGNGAGTIRVAGTGTTQTLSATLGVGVASGAATGTGTTQSITGALAAGVGRITATGTGSGLAANLTAGTATGRLASTGTGTPLDLTVNLATGVQLPTPHLGVGQNMYVLASIEAGTGDSNTTPPPAYRDIHITVSRAPARWAAKPGTSSWAAKRGAA
jgi:hypothetical protein